MMGTDKLSPNTAPVLMVGIPRSGTTWQFNTLCQAPNVAPVFEPDNEALNPFAIYYKRGQHRFPPVPGKSDKNRQEQFWSIVFQGGWKYNLFYRMVKAVYLRDIRRIEAEIESNSSQIIPSNNLIECLDNPQLVKPVPNTWLLKKTDRLLHRNIHGKRVIVKSVHCARQLEWINQIFKPEIVIILRRLPNLIASYIRLRLNDSIRGIEASPRYASNVNQLLKTTTSIEELLLHKMIIQSCELTRSLIDFKDIVPQARLIQHEEACLDPEVHFRELFQQLSLRWSQDVAQQITLANKPGSGFIPMRNAAEEQNRYSDVLTEKHLDLIAEYCQIYQLMELL
ncbi:hypothetical protein ACFL45_00270 [Candidatus Neomarinimicrobiota bacterium]